VFHQAAGFSGNAAAAAVAVARGPRPLRRGAGGAAAGTGAAAGIGGKGWPARYGQFAGGNGAPAACAGAAASIAPPNDFSVAIVLRWTSRLWTVVRSMLRFRFSHCSTARRSAMRLSSSSTSSVGAIIDGSVCGRRVANCAMLEGVGSIGSPVTPHTFFTRSNPSLTPMKGSVVALLLPAIVASAFAARADSVSHRRRQPRRLGGAATFCSIAPKIDAPDASNISMRTLSPYFMNAVAGLPSAIISSARLSAMHE
jgi:hypothetical protein